MKGYANGACAYKFIAQYAAQCNVMESSGKTSGNCDIDVDECASSPCKNNATCTDSTKKPAVSTDMYQCACTAGYANGVCAYSYIRQYLQACAVTTSAAGGNCDTDVDECKSSPCKNGAACTDSTVDSSVPVNTYRCTCLAGFANGFCGYQFINEYKTESVSYTHLTLPTKA